MDLLTLNEYDGKWVKAILSEAEKIKAKKSKYLHALDGKVLSMLFMKPSTRTSTSFAAGMIQLGGQAIYLDWRNTNFTKGKLSDEVKCIDRYSDAIMARVFTHQQVREIAEAAEAPVINGLCDTYHPCQALADILTIKEKIGSYKFKLAYVGDGNNVCNSLIIACAKVGAEIAVANPKGYGPNKSVIEYGLRNGLTLHTKPSEACKDADIIYTDVWVSMGKETEKEKRLKAFKGYKVTKELLGDALFMHCLPAIRGQEVTDEVIDSSQSIVFDQAENRLHAQKAVLLKLVK